MEDVDGRRQVSFGALSAWLYNELMQTRGDSAQRDAAMHGTTVLCVRKDNKGVLIADGQVTMGDHVMKHSAKKTRRLYQDKVLAGFAGLAGGADCFFLAFAGGRKGVSGDFAEAAG